MTTSWSRMRFRVPGDDPRPLAVPAPGPWWCSGYVENDCVVVAYVPCSVAAAPAAIRAPGAWPDATHIEECGAHEPPAWSGRFPAVDGWDLLAQAWTPEHLKACAEQMGGPLDHALRALANLNAKVDP